jgi:hypothetical protein
LLERPAGRQGSAKVVASALSMVRAPQVGDAI